jgi:phosphohistidine phosphatase
MHKVLAVILLGTLSLGSFAQNTKTIYLVRHAKSSHDNPDLADFDRPLAKRGHADAKLMAELLKRKGIDPDIMLASPSKRTQQTAEYFKNALYKDYNKITLDSSIYRCSPTKLIHQLSLLDDKHSSVMVFAHNPATTRAANFFQIDKLIDNVPTTGIVAIEFGITEWHRISKSKGTLKFFEYPKKNKK